MKSQIELGKEYQDRLTGFAGVATVRAEYYTGMPRVTLERKGDAEEKKFRRREIGASSGSTEIIQGA